MDSTGFSLSLITDDIVISGIGGRYPESESLDEFRDNLFANVDMITEDDRRWPPELLGISPRMGMLKEIDKFDAGFFGIVPKVAEEIDPQGRILLETTWEALIDAGVNPQSLRGSNTGVYVGYTSVAMPDGVPQMIQEDIQSSKVESLLWFQGGSKAFYANRVSFVFDFHGPSMSIDVACASSMVCLDLALTDMRLGKCDQAIVAGVSVTLQPFTNHIYQSNNIGAPDGRSKVWDQDANGYVRGETVCTLFLQRKCHSKRIYATVLHSKTNIDGYKASGMFFPSTESQYDLMKQTYTEAGINPLEVNYFEAHGTGTKVGDLQEAKAILKAYCGGRKEPLPIGLLKSNIGHGEGASGVASLSKVCILYENGKIPANLNLNTIKEDIAEMVPPLDPVVQNRDYEPGIVGVNSFGIGGVNAHALLKPNNKRCTAHSFEIVDNIPRLVNIIGRTEQSILQIMDFIEKNPQKITREFLALLGETVNFEACSYSAGFPYRGSVLIKKNTSGYLYNRTTSKVDNVRRPICFFFSGMGSQWPAMAKSLMGIRVFADTIQTCAEILKKNDLNLLHILLSDDAQALNRKLHHFVAITSMQLALVNVFTALGLKPDFIIGHSFGEIACAYADNCLTLEQSVMTSYWRGKAIEDSNVEHGMMAAVGLSWEETQIECPEGVYAACHNAIDSVTISGSYDKVDKFVKKLSDEKIFAREVQCANIPFHCPLLNPAVKPMTKGLRQIISLAKCRSEKWLSTSVEQKDWDSELGKRASAEYFVNNLINPVFFHEASKLIPKDAIIIELAPHSLFSAIFKRSLPNANYVGLMKRFNNDSNLEMFLNSLSQLYQLGVNLDINQLYSKVDWPVPLGTQSISSLIRWDHSKSFHVKKYPEFHSKAFASDFIQRYSLSNPDDQFVRDHAFDGKCVLPASSYLLLAWRRLATSLGQQWYRFPVVFENVHFKRLTPLTEAETKLTARLLDPTGDFLVLDGETIVASGRISSPTQMDFNYQSLVEKFENKDTPWAGHHLDTNQFYTELSVRGFDYGPNFKQIQKVEYASFDQSKASVRWQKNWITFVESMIQLLVTHNRERSIHVALNISSLKCDPKILFDSSNALFDVVTDGRINCSVAHGIEIQGVEFVGIAHKNPLQNVKLEKYQFVPFNESAAIEQDHKESLLNYIESCNLLAKRMQSLTAKPTLVEIKQLEQILSQPTKDNQVLLNTLIALYQSVIDENGNVLVEKFSPEMFSQVMRQNGFDLSFDLLNQDSSNIRLMRSSLDLVNENRLRNMTVIEINYTNNPVVKNLLASMSYFFHYPLIIDYNLITKNVHDLPEDFKQNSDYQLTNWDVAKSSLPTIQTPADLVVFKDCGEFTSLNLHSFIADLASNINEGGFLFGLFRKQFTEAEMFLHSISDFCPSNHLPEERIELFEKIACENNFVLISNKSDSITTSCLLFRKVSSTPKQAVVEVKFGQFDNWVDQLKNTFTQYKNRPKNENIWIVADDSNLNGVLGLVNCLFQEPGGDRFKCIYSDQPLPRPVDFTRQPYQDILRKNLAMNVFHNGLWGSYRLLNLEPNYNLIETEDAFVDVEKRGDISSLKWVQLENLSTQDKVKVQIHYSGLDYNDLGSDSSERSIGTEFSGIRTDTAKPVMGLTSGKAIATSIEVKANQLFDLPSNWSLEDGASTIGSLFTVWHGLVEQARLSQGESILIHPGTSPLGLIAIEICQLLNCQVLATSTNVLNRNYLRELCSVSLVFDPNDAEFEHKIREATGGKGVDVLIISQDAQLSTSVVANGGRLVRIDQSSKQVQLLPNVQYFNISSLQIEYTEHRLQEFRKWLSGISDLIKPIDRAVFNRDQIDRAFAALSSAKMIGKVVVRIRDENECLKLKATAKTRFDPCKSYILVGGLGGLGLEVAYWLVERGAKKLILVSRSGIKNDYQYIFVKRITNLATGVTVKISTSDPSSISGAQKLITESETIGPVGGIFHFATVLSDAFLEDQTPASFGKVCAPKMDALGYLDTVTREKCPHLDHFVAFSSQSSGRGFVGQNNYGYANSVMEHICENRVRDGFPGKAIQYGPIGDVGLWAQNDHVDLTSIGMVIDTQRIISCIEVLDRFLCLGARHPIVSTIVRLDALQQSSGGSSACKNHIWHGIGIDISSLQESLTLGEVGMDSILAVEMQQRVEREYEVALTVDQIKLLTVAQVKHYQTESKQNIKEQLIEFKSKHCDNKKK